MREKKDKYYYAYHISRIILGFLAKLLFRIKIYKPDTLPKPPYIVASNHASYLDPPLIGLVFSWDKLDFMAKRELFEGRIFGAWMRAVRCIELKRGENSIKGIREALIRVKKGGSVVIFPEGTRSPDGSLLEGKEGSGFIIHMAGVPIIPVYIEGSGVAVPKDGRMKIGEIVSIYVDEPILPPDFKEVMKNRKDYVSISNLVMDRIGNLKNKYKGIAEA